MTARYFRSEIPASNPARMVEAMNAELAKLESVITALAAGSQVPLHREQPPTQPAGTLGMFSAASWDPGAGSGLYVSSGQGWHLVTAFEPVV